MADSQKYVATNVFDINNPNVLNGYIDSSGNYAPYATNGTLYVPITAGTSYTVSGIIRASQSTVVRIATFTAIPSTQTPSVNLYTLNQGDSITITAGNNENYLFVMFCGDSDYNAYGSVQAALTTNCANLHIDTYAWQHSLRKLTTATEAIENPLYSDGTAITSYTIKGNTVQSGTPIPSNPVMPNGVGERTENLFDINAWVSSITGVSGQGSFSYSNGVLSVTSNNSADAYTTPFGASSSGVYKVPVKPNTKYTFSIDIGNNGHFMMFENGLTTSGYIHYNVVNGSSFTTQSDTTFMTFRYGTRAEQALGTTVTISNIMLVEGETIPTSYIPYGYKIPVLSVQTVNNYLGSIQSTRQIKKLVLTGGADETWNNAGDGTMYRSDISDYLKEAIVTSVCTHYPCNANVPSSTAAQYGVSFITSSSYNRLYIKDTTYSTATDFKNWLATEYANGTPVTVWYVLATPQTAAVNEPLMKIGTYADTLSNAASIPTTDGANSITVDTTVQPSEFSATWSGWHDASVKEYDGSDWQ